MSGGRLACALALFVAVASAPLGRAIDEAEADQVVEGEENAPPPAAGPLTPLAAHVEAQVKKALSGVALRAEPERFGRAGELLLVEVRAGPPHLGEESVHADALAIARSVLPQCPDWAGLRIVYVRSWRDAFGAVEGRPWVVATMERKTFERLVLENLSAAEVFGHFHVERPTYAGLVLWDR